MKGLLLAGGHGTRLRPLTFAGNKHMIPIANEPMLFYGLRDLAEGGVKDVAIVLGPVHEGIEESVGNGHAFGLNVTYVEQGEPKGLAHAVLCAQEFLEDDPFLMYLGDNLLQEGTREFINEFQGKQADAVVGVTPVRNPSGYGVAEVNDGRLVSLVEKPEAPKSNLALIGVYAFSPRIHDVIRRLHPSPRGELEITDAIWELDREGGRVSVRRVQGWWKDTGRPEDLLDANDLVLGTRDTASFSCLGTVSHDCKVDARVGIGRGTQVAQDVTLIGPTLIGDDVRIEPGAIVGPGVALGRDCVIGRQSVISRSIIMGHSIIGARIRLTNSIIGRGSNILNEHGLPIDLSCVVGDATTIQLGESSGRPPSGSSPPGR